MSKPRLTKSKLHPSNVEKGAGNVNTRSASVAPALGETLGHAVAALAKRFPDNDLHNPASDGQLPSDHSHLS